MNGEFVNENPIPLSRGRYMDVFPDGDYLIYRGNPLESDADSTYFARETGRPANRIHARKVIEHHSPRSVLPTRGTAERGISDRNGEPLAEGRGIQLDPIYIEGQLPRRSHRRRQGPSVSSMQAITGIYPERDLSAYEQQRLDSLQSAQIERERQREIQQREQQEHLLEPQAGSITEDERGLRRERRRSSLLESPSSTAPPIEQRERYRIRSRLEFGRALGQNLGRIHARLWYLISQEEDDPRITTMMVGSGQYGEINQVQVRSKLQRAIDDGLIIESTEGELYPFGTGHGLNAEIELLANANLGFRGAYIRANEHENEEISDELLLDLLLSVVDIVDILISFGVAGAALSILRRIGSRAARSASRLRQLIRRSAIRPNIPSDLPNLTRPLTPDDMLDQLLLQRGFLSVAPRIGVRQQRRIQQKLAEIESEIQQQAQQSGVTISEREARQRALQQLQSSHPELFPGNRPVDLEGAQRLYQDGTAQGTSLPTQGTEIGTGFETHAIAQIIDAEGNQVVSGLGAYLGRGTHAEPQALSSLGQIVEQDGRALLSINGTNINVSGGKLMVTVDQLPCSPSSADCAGLLRNFSQQLGLELEVWVPSRPRLRGQGSVAPRTAARGWTRYGRSSVTPRQLE